MPTIYLAAALWLAAVILRWSGWLDKALRDVSPRTVTAFLFVWPVSLLTRLRLTEQLAVNGAWGLTLAVAIGLAGSLPRERLAFTTAVAMLLGGLCALTVRMLDMLPLLGTAGAWAAAGAGIGLMASLLVPGGLGPLFACSVALPAAEALSSSGMASAPGAAADIGGDAGWAAAWWLAAFATVGWAGATRKLAASPQRLFRASLHKRGGGTDR